MKETGELCTYTLNMSSESKKETEKKETDPKTMTTTNTLATEQAAAAALIEAMEEDDEFEEFDPEHWGKGEATDVSQQQKWMDNWDDDMDDDFTKNLRAELLKSSKPTNT